MKKSFLMLCIALSVLSSCRNEKKESGTNVPETDNSMYLTRADTVAATQLVETYMSHVLKKEYADAAGMLYNVKKGSELRLLSNEELQKVMTSLRCIPVSGYRIEHLMFKEALNNEIKCSVQMSEDRVTKWVFKPIRYLGEWKLCLKDTALGD